jgi:hypothetical protein
MTTVFLVDGFGFQGFLANITIVNDQRFKGAAVVQFQYPNMDATIGNVSASATKLSTMATNMAGPVVFVGVSMGAQVLCSLLRSLGRSKLGDWRFLLLANPEHRVTGRRSTPQYGGLGVPSDTPYDVTDIAAQYDFWADSPNVGGMFSLANAYSSMYGNGVHMFGYNTLDPKLPYPFVSRGNVRDMWVPGKTSWPWSQSAVEKGYERPVKL